MSKIIGTAFRAPTSWKAAFAAGALTAVAAATPALAWDPQATPAQIDTALSYHAYAASPEYPAGPYASAPYASGAYAAAPYSSGPYASAVHPRRSAARTTRTRSGPYASARRGPQSTPDTSRTAAPPVKNFQDYK